MKTLCILILFFLTLSGCGEAQFYKHLQYENNAVRTEGANKDAIERTANSLVYSLCEEGIGYCKDGQYIFSINQISPKGFELVFFHSFGSYPGPENENVSKFSEALAKNCGACSIREKESSSWGFRNEETNWVQTYP